MTTDFNYSNTAITSAGPFKPKNRNVPMNARYRVETYADIATIPVPAVGELVFVLSDENNDNQQNIYVIKSLKASNLGVADSLVDEVIPLKTFLGTDDINLSDYVTEDELNTSLSNKVDKVSGYSLVSDTEIARLANVDNYDDTELMNLIPDKTSDLENDSNFISSNDEIDATTLNGKTISGPMTKEEYDAITDIDPNTIYLVNDDDVVIGIPDYTVDDANKALTVNSTGTSVGWNDVNVDLDDYYTKSEVEERIANISTGGSVDLSSYATISYVDEAVNNIVIESGNISFRAVIEDEVFCVINEDNTTTVTYGSLIVSKTALTVNENETATFTIALNQAPTINQIVSISTANNNCGIDKNSLTFTSDNYAKPQTITVTGNDDSSYDNKTDIITITSTGVSSETIDVTVINTDVPVTISSISATYTQGDTVVYPTTSLNELKQNLEVIATYSDSSTKVITNYELSGTLSVGTSTITVTFEGKTDTFNVIVSEAATLNSISATYSQGNTVVYTDTEFETFKDDLVVKANYSDGNSIDVTEYTLSGTLEVGTSTITVTYQGLTTTFDVNVSEKPVITSMVSVDDEYVTINTSTFKNVNNATVERTGNDNDHIYFAFASIIHSYAGATPTIENAAELHKEIDYVECSSLAEFTNGNDEWGDVVYTFVNGSLVYRIPTSIYTESNESITTAFASIVPELSIKRDADKSLTTYEITDEIIDTFNSRNPNTTLEASATNYIGFIGMDPSLTGITTNISTGLCSLTGYISNTSSIAGVESWYVNVNGGRLQYSIPHDQITGDSIDELKTYLKTNRLIFYIFS